MRQLRPPQICAIHVRNILAPISVHIGGSACGCKRPSSDEFQRHITRGLLTVEHIGVVGASLGGQITTLMSLYSEQLDQLG